MRSIVLLLILVLTISAIKTKENEQDNIKYVGPIVYSDEKPPIVIFPNPTTNSKIEQNISSKNANIEYVPFPYEELPVLIYKSKEKPPIHLVSQFVSTDVLNNSLSIDKRLGESVSSDQRGGRALKWSNFKLFNDKPIVMKTQKRGPTEMSGGLNLFSHTIDYNNSSSVLKGGKSPLSLASAPHVVYSGHPPIHVFPQPIIIKEPEFAEMAASEQFHSMKSPISSNSFDSQNGVSVTNKNEGSSSPASSHFYSFSSTPVGSGGSKSFGFRVKTRGNKQDTDYSSSNHYENYEDSYSPQLSDGSSDTQSEENGKYKPSSHYSNSIDSNNEREFDKEYDRPFDSSIRDKSREKYPKFNSNNWFDWETDNSWLSSLLGYNRFPNRGRRPVALSIVNSPTNEHLVFAANTPTNAYDIENLALMNPHFRPNGWVTGMTPLRQTASALRPIYSMANLFNYRRPPIAAPPPPPPFFTRFTPVIGPTGTNAPGPPLAMKPLGVGPPLMSLPTMSYPIRVPISPLMMYGIRRPPIGLNGDLAFAESTRNTTNSLSKKWAQIPEDIQMSGSHTQSTYVLPSAKPSASLSPNKPPIIIYQGMRPPIHVYKQPNLTIGHSFDVQSNTLSNVHRIHDSPQSIEENREEMTPITTLSPYFQFYTTEDSIQSFGSKSGSPFYFGENSAFSPRHSTGDWIPVKQHINGSKDSETKL